MQSPSPRKRKQPVSDQARLILLVGVVLLSALSIMAYVWTKEATVLVANQALTFIVGYYFPKQDSDR